MCKGLQSVSVICLRDRTAAGLALWRDIVLSLHTADAPVSVTPPPFSNLPDVLG